MKTNTNLGAGAIDKVTKGMNLVADAVKLTIGPKGRNVLIERMGAEPIITNDGVTIAKSINPTDAQESVGAELIKSVASNADDMAGDGTTTATILTSSIINSGLNRVKTGTNPMFLRTSMEKYKKVITDFLEANVLPVEDSDRIRKIASISAGSEETGKLVSDIMLEIGKNGNIVLQDGNYDTVVEFTKGASIDEGHLNPYLVYDSTKQETVLENPYILLTNKRVGAIKPLEDLVREIIKQNRDLLIVAEDVEGEALALMIMLKNRGNVNGKVVGIKAPDFSDRRLEILEDLGVYTGATVITGLKNMNLEDVGTDELGTCAKVVIKQNSTVFVGSPAPVEAIQERVVHLKSKLAEAKTDYDKTQLTNRIARLDGGIAVIKVGGCTTAEVVERKLRIEDAINATKHAMKDGAVPGGGLALFSAAKYLEDMAYSKEDQVAVDILIEALKQPLIQIVRNSGVTDTSLVEYKLWLASGSGSPMYHSGFDAKDNSIKNIVEEGILDPLAVTKSAVVNAISLAGLFLTTAGVITLDDNNVVPVQDNSMGGLM